jgi:hypothetical protein
MILGEVILNLQTLVGLMIFYSKYGNDNTFNKNKYDEYIKMQHEINARFSQAISDIKFLN